MPTETPAPPPSSKLPSLNKSSSFHNFTQVPTAQNQNSDEKPGKKPGSSIKAKIKNFSVRTLRDSFTSKYKKQSVVKPKDHSEKNSSSKIHDEKETLSNLISSDLEHIKVVSEKLEEYKGRVNEQVEDALKKFEKLKEGGKEKDLRELKKVVTKLKLKVPSKYKIDAEKDPHGNHQSSDATRSKGDIPQEVLDKMPQLYKANMFVNSLEFQDLLSRYRGLTIELKLCLLCFSVFPEDAIIKKRLMVYWWIGEGFVPPIKRTGEGIENQKTAEEYGKEFFDKLMELGFIEPVNNKGSLIIGSCKMHPFIRSVVVILAEKAKFFDFDLKGYPTVEFLSSYRACLSGKGLVYIAELEKLHMLFNVKEANLELKAEWLLKMSNVNVLYLGRWQASATQHVEVEDAKFLEGLENMKHLRFFSLQGISGITELPESISKLKYLTILDLRACHSLEVIPEGIGLLENLTHLDMSECYLLEHMPKKLARLTKLRVLKGFVVGDMQGKHSCTLDDLAKLPRLRKLSIYSGMKNFPTDSHVSALQQLQALLKLTIAWGGGALQGKAEGKPREGKKKDGGLRATPKKQQVRKALRQANAFKLPTLPSQLEKLDLKCYPEKVTPGWLNPANLKGLKKLYIRGGKFYDLGQFQDLDDSWDADCLVKDTWKVEQLRLKYLSELEMDWRELRELFPNLIYLEKVKCPKLSFFPCNESGVWMNKTMLKQM
ncbi:unnamed protein product [Ilex paraguariensis]|uniref:Disease resistance RPP13-like protein 4 n=1 Tax=Ilex paraguariensis TaxID=185542 RepID=A0ABC8U4U7_9AQUA